jgi:glycosyltransferase involved in cell wall biosynthesis
MSAFGGAERVIQQILQIYPNADVFSVLNVVPENQQAFLGGRQVTSSFLQNLPFIERYYRHLLNLWPLAVEQLDVTEYDLVISSHHSVAYGVLTRPDQAHISYVHSPMRYAWDLQHQYLQQSRLGYGPLGLLARNILHKARIWDYAAAQRPDSIVTNSHFVAERMRRIHRRESMVVFPPVAVAGWPCRAVSGSDTYVSIGRLVPYKRTDLLVRAFARMPHRRLKIVGEGPEARKLAAIAPPNVEILGYQPTAMVRELLAGARAYLFAGIEDFGITPVEAQAAGVPVIAYRGGGLMETVIGLDQLNPTGVFFDTQSEAAVIGAVEAFEANAPLITPANCVANAARFSEERFRDEFAGVVEAMLEAPRNAPLQRQHQLRTWTQPPSAPEPRGAVIPAARSVARQEA